MPFFQLSFFDRLSNWQKPQARLRVFKPPKTPTHRRTAKALNEATELKCLWIKIRQNYFHERPDLDLYKVCWSSRRQKRVLGSCNIHRHLVRIATELRHDSVKEWLDPLLYHEMCHAVLGVSVRSVSRRRAWHGTEFKRLEHRHPKTSALDLWIKTGGWRDAVRRDRARRASSTSLERCKA